MLIISFIIMISLKQIKAYLEKSLNPLIFFDDDADGLSSFLLIRKFLDKGKGVAVKHNILDDSYLKSIEYYNPDLILVLDKHGISQDFVDKVNNPILWIDHHPIEEVKGVKHFNPKYFDPKDNRPTSYWCYEITKENLWIAAIGIVADWCLEHHQEFIKTYKGLSNPEFNDPPDVLFNTKLGLLAKLFTFILTGKTQDSKKCINILTKINDPYEILERTTPRGKYLWKRFEKLNKEYERILNDASKNSLIYKNILVYTYYIKDASYTGVLANELIYKHPDKVIIIAREKEDKMRLSIRSNYKNGVILQPIIKKAFENLRGYGGGHDHACGGEINKEDFKEFIDRIEHLINKR